MQYLVRAWGLSLSLTHSITLSIAHSLTLSLTHSLSLTITQSLAHYHSLALSLTITHLHSHYHSLGVGLASQVEHRLQPAYGPLRQAAGHLSRLLDQLQLVPQSHLKGEGD